MIVVDASVVIKWLQEKEPHRNKALVLYSRHIEGIDKILVPDFIYLEIANVLVTKSRTPKREIGQALNLILSLNLSTHRLNNKDLLLASRLAKEYETAVYDILYAVIAKQNRTTLVTADDRFIKKVNFKFVKHIKDLEN